MEDSSQMSLQAYDHLAEKNRDLRKANVKLLEEKRELLLQVQQDNRARSEAARLSETCEALSKKVELLESRKQGLSSFEVIPKVQKSEETFRQFEERNYHKDDKTECSCESAKKLSEAVKVNHQWNDAYQRSIDRYHKLEKANRRLEAELKDKDEENKILRDLVEKCEADLRSKSISGYQRSVSREKFCSNDDIEALKIQLLAYQEDFSCEKEEKERLKTDSRTFQIKLQEANVLVEMLQNQVDEYKHYVARMVEEKQVVLGELRRLSSSSFFEKTPTFHEPVQRNSSYPLHSNDIIPRSLLSPRLRRSDSDLYKGADVVRDSHLRTPSR